MMNAVCMFDSVDTTIATTIMVIVITVIEAWIRIVVVMLELDTGRMMIQTHVLVLEAVETRGERRRSGYVARVD